QAVQDTLDELNVHDLPVVTALNKVDALTPEHAADARLRLGELFDNGVAISALTGVGIGELLARVSESLYANLVPMKIVIPYRQGQLISLFHEQAIVDHVE